MGDPCNVYITCRRRDVKAVCRAVLGDGKASPTMEYKLCRGVVELEFDELNHGAYVEIKAFAKIDIPFHGRHGTGSNYPAGLFASDGKSYKHCDRLDDSDWPIVEVSPELVPDDCRMKDAAEYWRLRKLAMKLIGQKEERHG